MYYVLLAIAAVGHVILWMAIVNRLHSLAMNRKLMHVLTALCGLALALIPVAIVVAYYAWENNRALMRLHQFATGYYVFGCLVVFLFACAHRLWTIWHPERRGAMLSNHTTRVGLRRTSEEPLTSGVHSWLARLPGNQAFDIHVHEKQLAIPRLPSALAGLRIAHISDLHMSGRIGRDYFHTVVDSVNECQPDIVAVTGDLVERSTCLDWIPDTFGRLRAPAGVFYVLGNHDLKIDVAALHAALQRAGLIHVGGRVLDINCQNSPLLAAGNELPWFGPAPDISQPPARSPQSPFRLLLSHSPDQFAWAQRHDFDLMLAGHNHGGQVRLPLLGPLLAPSRHGVRYASGTFKRGNTVLHVSRGTGSHTPLRYNCPPEIAVLVLNP